MQKVILSLLVIIIAWPSHAQVLLEKSFSESAWVTNLSNSGFKYYSMDVTNNQCKLYNLDYSLWKTIPVTVPSGYTLYDVQYVSENLFSTDGLIGLAYMYYQYNSTGQYYTYEVKIIKENGEVLLTAPGAAFMYVMNAGTTGSKFVTYRYDYSTYPYFLGTNFYGLPGVFTGDQPSPGDAPVLKHAYPNPAGTYLTIKCLPTVQRTPTELIVLSSGGKEILRVRVNSDQDYYQLNTASYPSGMYHYLLLSDGKVIQQDKFLVRR